MANDIDQTLADGEARPRGFLRRHWLGIAIGAACLVALFLLIRYFHHKAETAAQMRDFRNAPVAVGVASASRGDIQVRIPAIGTVTTLANITVRTQISGYLQKILFTEGQLVHAGDVLAQIDPRPYEAAVKQAEGNLKRDQALLANAKLDLERYRQLVKEDSIAVQQLDTQRALVDQYEGVIETDQGALKAAQVNLVYTRVLSPVAGRVGLRQVDQGNYVTPGDANGIVVVNQLQPISVIFPVPEDDVAAIVRRQRASGPLAVEIYDRTNAAKLGVGKLLTFDNQIDTTTGTIKLRALFDNADGTLFPNQFVNVQLLLERLENQLVIPNAAVRRGAPNGVQTTFVYVVGAERTVKVRPVELGAVDGERVAVIKGLDAGEQVVTEGGDRLREGAHVVLPGAAPATGGRSPQSAAGPTPAAKAGHGGSRGHKPGAGNGASS